MDDTINVTAYYIAENSGFKKDPQQCWLEAEKQIISHLRPVKIICYDSLSVGKTRVTKDFRCHFNNNGYITEMIYDNERIKFPSRHAANIIKKLYDTYVYIPKYNEGRANFRIIDVLEAVSTDSERQEVNDVKDMLRLAKIDPRFVFYSNKSNPYYGYLPHPMYDTRVYPKNLYELGELFDEIRDSENRFGVTYAEGRMRFWYNWRD